MKKIGDLYQSGDWKGEKHVPVIHAPETVKAGEEFEVKLYFQPEGSKFPVEIGKTNFTAHGESDLYTEPKASFVFKTEKAGTLYATSYCNIHGLWENSAELKVE